MTNSKKTGVRVKCRSMPISTLLYADIAVMFAANEKLMRSKRYLSEVVQEMVSRSEC